VVAVQIPQTARAVLESGRLAHVVTVNRDGSPHVTIEPTRARGMGPWGTVLG
jgi:hypothetical protein